MTMTNSMRGSGKTHAPIALIRQHFMVWGSMREGMSMMGAIAKVAVLDNGTMMLVTRGAVEKNSTPPGFVRFLSEEELCERGLHAFIPELLARVGRKWNAGQATPQKKPAPYYRRFGKSKY